MRKVWLLYDDRANPIDGTDEAMVLTVSRSLREARRDAKDGYGACHIWQYDEADSGELVNEQYVERHA